MFLSANCWLVTQPKEVGLPVHAYVAKEQVKEEATEKAQKVFQHLPISVGQTEAEEIGVELLLRDVKDATISTLSTEVVGKLQVRFPSPPLQAVLATYNSSGLSDVHP